MARVTLSVEADSLLSGAPSFNAPAARPRPTGSPPWSTRHRGRGCRGRASFFCTMQGARFRARAGSVSVPVYELRIHCKYKWFCAFAIWQHVFENNSRLFPPAWPGYCCLGGGGGRGPVRDTDRACFTLSSPSRPVGGAIQVRYCCGWREPMMLPAPVEMKAGAWD